MRVSPFNSIPGTGRSRFPLPQPKQSAPAAPEPLRILSIRYDADSSRFEIRFSAQPQPERAAEFLSVTPPLALNVSSSGDRWYISAGFEPGKFYQFTVKEGLPAAGGVPPLKRTERPGFIAAELSPRLNFISNGSFFPVSGSVRELPVETVNAGKVKVELSQVYPNRLPDFLQSPWGDYSRSLRTTAGGRSVSGTVRALCHYRDHYLGLQDGGAQGNSRVFRIAAVKAVRVEGGRPLRHPDPLRLGLPAGRS